MGDPTICKYCKKEISAKNITTHETHCHRSTCICSICNEAIARSQYQQHLQDCHKVIPCSKCGREVAPLAIFLHEKEECPKRMEPCEYCDLQLPLNELESHKEKCGSKTQRCKGCTKYVQQKFLQFHYENDHKYLQPDEKDLFEKSGDDGMGTEEECPICLGPITLPLSLECGHVFCMICVKGIASTTKNCAICRRDIPRDMLMDIRFCREEDVIKNYVNKPREKKVGRSHSVPSRGSYSSSNRSSSTTRRVGHTTQDYDSMVSALLSSRTSNTPYRYQRPSNTHTPPSYTPYSFSSTSTTTTDTTTSCQDSCKDDDDDDDCCCASASNKASKDNEIKSPITSSSSNIPSSSLQISKSSHSITSSANSSTATTTTPSSKSSRSYSSSSIPNYPSVNGYKSTQSTYSNSALIKDTNTSYASTTLIDSKVTSSTDSKYSVASSTVSSNTTNSTSNSNPLTASSSLNSCISGARPRRPTSLALSSSLGSTSILRSPTQDERSPTSPLASRRKRSKEPPANASQEEYDRWLAFQLATSDGDLPPSDFNQKHKPLFRRSLSMPEPSMDNDEQRNPASDSEGDGHTDGNSSRRPPASPRYTSNSIHASGNSSSTSSSSSSSRASSLSKSSSDSSATNSSSALSSGARPKETGLKKRVSFKEEAPPRREAPVMLPCEFCEEVFPERDLMRHQTSCEHNETHQASLSRAQRSSTPGSLISTPPALPSPTRPPPSGFTSNRLSPTRHTFSPTTSRSTTPTRPPPSSTTPSSRSSTPTRPPPGTSGSRSSTPTKLPPVTTTTSSRSSTPTRLPPSGSGSAINGKLASSGRTSSNKKSPPTSPPPRSKRTPSSPPTNRASPSVSSVTTASPSSNMTDGFVSPSDSRPSSVSPCTAPSVSSSSGVSSCSGVSSSSSFSSSSVSTTPSTSSSASPVPVIAAPDTPTDIEGDFDDDEEPPYARPRKGRLLSSAIFSWRNISGPRARDRPKYTRSNTAPLEDTGDCETPPPGVITSHSASQLPMAPSPDPSCETNEETPSPPPTGQKSTTNDSLPPKPPSPTQQGNSSPKSHKNIAEKPPIVSAVNKDISDSSKSESVFVKKVNKYKAPQPPKVQNDNIIKQNDKKENSPTNKIEKEQSITPNLSQNCDTISVNSDHCDDLSQSDSTQSSSQTIAENGSDYQESTSPHKRNSNSFPSPGVPENHRFYPSNNHSEEYSYSTIPQSYSNYYPSDYHDGYTNYTSQDFSYISDSKDVNIPMCGCNYNNNNTINKDLVPYQENISSISPNEPNNTYVVHGYLQLDSKPMMTNDTQVGSRHPCAYCDKQIDPEKLNYHQTICELSQSPPIMRSGMDENACHILRHNKGKAPSPPSDSGHHGKSKLGRSNSVKEENSSSFLRKSGIRRLQRTSSIKDLSTSNASNCSNGLFIGDVSPFIAKRWASKESLESSSNTQTQIPYHSPYEDSYSGVAPVLANNSTAGTSRAWSSHINMLRQDIRTARVAAEVAADMVPSNYNSSAFYEYEDAESGYSEPYYYHNSEEEEEMDVAIEEEVEKIASKSCNNNQSDKLNSFLLDMRSALTKNSMSPFGISQLGNTRRERSSSGRPRPSSLYSTSENFYNPIYASTFECRSPCPSQAYPSFPISRPSAFTSTDHLSPSIATKRRFLR